MGTEADPRIDGYLASIIDEDWVNSELPLEDIYVPLGDLPDQEQVSSIFQKFVKPLQLANKRSYTYTNVLRLLFIVTV